MKTANLFIIGAITVLLASCASSKDLSYDDDVYGEFTPKLYAGTESSDEYFENEDYYNEDYAKKNETQSAYNNNSNVNYGNQNNYYYGGSGYNAYSNNNCNCNCNYNYKYYKKRNANLVRDC